MKPKFERGDAFLAKKGDKPKWLVDQLIPADSIVLISGPPKRGKKTWLAMTIGMCVAANRPYARINPKATGTVLIVEEEGSRAGTQDRLEAIDKMVGQPSGLTNLFIAHRKQLKLDDEECVDQICQQAKLTSAKIVILDALSYLHTGDPNSEKDLQKVASAINLIRNNLVGGSVILIHHLNKTLGENKDAHPDSQIRGSGVIAGFYDTHIACRAYGNKGLENVHVDVTHREASEAKYVINWHFSGPKGQEHLESMTMRDRFEDDSPKEEFDPSDIKKTKR